MNPLKFIDSGEDNLAAFPKEAKVQATTRYKQLKESAK